MFRKAVAAAALVVALGADVRADPEITNYQATRVATSTWIVSGQVINANLDYCIVGLSGYISDAVIPDEYGYFSTTFYVAPSTFDSVEAIAEDYDAEFNPRYSEEVSVDIYEP